MKFSLLMSLYFKEDPIAYEQCLSSIVNQSLLPDEVIIVHDGPIGNELLKIEKSFINVLPIKIIKLFTNVGLGKALNEGLRYCTNEYIARMDTDDICYKDRFKIQLRFMIKNSDIDICSSYISEFKNNDPDDIYAYRKLPISHNEISKYIKKRSPINHMAVIYKKEVIESIGGYKHLLYMEDYYLCLRLFLAGYKFANIPQILVNVRAGNNMIIKRGGIIYLKSEFKLLKFMLEKKIIGYIDFLLLFLLRGTVRIIPIYCRKLVYNIIRE